MGEENEAIARLERKKRKKRQNEEWKVNEEQFDNPDDADLINSNRQKLRDLDIKKKKKQNYNLSDEDEDDRKMRHDQVKRMKAMEMQSKCKRDEKKANKIKHHREDDIANDSDYE